MPRAMLGNRGWDLPPIELRQTNAPLYDYLLMLHTRIFGAVGGKGDLDTQNIATLAIAPVQSVFGRTGGIVATTNDYTWAQVNKTTSSLADVTTRDHDLLAGLLDDDHTQYHNDTRALTWLGTRSTTDLVEGTNLYYTDARSRTALSGVSPVTYNSTTGAIGFDGTVVDHGTLTGLTDDDHTQYLLANGTRGLSAAWDAGSWQIRAETFQSDIPTGTAPLTVTSTTKVTNLNADLLDDQSAAYYLDSANFTGTNWTDLTDLSATTLHKHDHGGQDGLLDDDHTQYALLAGRATGQTLIGGTASGDDLTLQSTSHATRGNILFGSAGNSVYDEVNNRLGLGVTSPLYRLDVENVNAVAAGGVASRVELSVNLPSSVGANQQGGLFAVRMNAASAGSITGLAEFQGINAVAEHNVNGLSVANLAGARVNSIVGPAVGAASGSASAVNIQGGVFDARANVATGTIGRILGGVFAGRNASTSGTIVRVAGGWFYPHQSGAGSTITDLYAGRFAFVDPVFLAAQLTAGTIVNSYGLYVDGPPASGATFTNPTVQLYLANSTQTGVMGLRQVGTTPHNRLQGAMTIGADAAPATSALLDLSSTVGALLVPRMTTTQRDALTATNGMVVYNSTLGKFQGYEAGAWTSFI